MIHLKVLRSKCSWLLDHLSSVRLGITAQSEFNSGLRTHMAGGRAPMLFLAPAPLAVSCWLLDFHQINIEIQFQLTFSQRALPFSCCYLRLCCFRASSYPPLSPLSKPKVKTGPGTRPTCRLPLPIYFFDPTKPAGCLRLDR